LRSAGPRERAALDAWLTVGSDPYADANAADVFHHWREAREPDARLDTALVLSTAGAARSAAEQTRALIAHRLRNGALVSNTASSVLRWLGEECDSIDDLPASVRLPGWRSTAAEAIARSALATAGAATTLRHLASRIAEGPFDRALLEATLRACLLDARRGPGESSSALGDAVRELTEALARVGTHDPTYARIVGLLLGRERNGALIGAGRWLTDDLRILVHRTALAHEPLAARDVALGDLASGSVPVALVPLLKEVAHRDPDPAIRERARQLVRDGRA
jgi:hypothetical protein